ncbi:MAG: 5-(carboxyamino)imidazole ribonucleotide mutase [Planctomycetes bacterium]|nr:5-(carboxyamino)imidazole ribonucleotide mutase [Planctomycetota bacterium]MBM4079303.1 5-(carboxyamino)imidazole ribonucleotide mutase [Planctomycetota bacterium]MBM4086005.1 5-(carboxyamino)imidazole ribonucleotide mutase [Planctomycetota bacterium]
MPPKKVGVVMGSDSDLPLMQDAIDTLKEFGIGFDVDIISAHRSPELAREYALNAEKNGYEVIIAAAGAAAHLAGVLAASTPLPVIGVPMPGSALNGLDALYAMVQMPPGVPVGTMAIGKPGARNAAIFAAQILAAADPDLRKKLKDFKKKLADGVAAKNKKVKAELGLAQ